MMALPCASPWLLLCVSWGVGKDRSGSKEGPLLEAGASEDTTDGSSSDGSITGNHNTQQTAHPTDMEGSSGLLGPQQ